MADDKGYAIKQTLLAVGATVLSDIADAAEVLDYVDPIYYATNSKPLGGAFYGPGTPYPTYQDYRNSPDYIKDQERAKEFMQEHNRLGEE